MVLSLAAIIKESVTKPNVSLTQARRAEAQQRSRHAGNGHVSKAGEGLDWPPQNPLLGPRETLLAQPRRTPCPAAHPAPWPGAVGEQQGGNSAGSRGAQGQTRTVHPGGEMPWAVVGLVEPCSFPTPMKIGVVPSDHQLPQVGETRTSSC